MKDLKKNKGITMIAMIITIVVLLVLALVTVRILINEGIIGKSEKTTGMYNKEEATEKMNLKITNLQILHYAKTQTLPNLQYVADELCEDKEIEYVLLEKQSVADKDKITVGENESIFTKLKEYPYEFEIDKSLRLASINGVKLADNTNNSEEIENLKTIIGQMDTSIEQLNAQITTLQTKITNLEQKDTDLQTAINNVNTAKTTYTYTELASTTSTTEVQVTLKNNLSNYKYVVISFSGVNQTFSGLIPIEMFKSKGIFCSSSELNAIAKYVSNTSCRIQSPSNNVATILYGVN